MKNWENVYESYKNGEKKEQYEQLKAKVEQKIITADEYQLYKKMTRIMENLPKVENIKEYQEKLENSLEILKNEYNARQAEEKYEKTKVSLEAKVEKNLKKQNELMAQRKKINIKLNEKGLDASEKEKLIREKDALEGKLENLKSEVDKNNEEFTKNEEDKKKAIKNEGLSKFSNKEIRERCFKIASMSSKCKLVASKLLEGESIQSIELKLADWKDRKFTSKTPLPLTKKERNEREQNNKVKIEEKHEVKIEKDNEINNEADKNIIKETVSEVNEKPVVVSEFNKEFPRLSKYMPKFLQNSFVGKAFVKVKNYFKEDNETEEIIEEAKAQIGKDVSEALKEKERIEKNKEKEKITKNNEKEKITKNNEKEKFKDYLKYDILEVADKGIDKVTEQRGKDKLEQAKQQAYNREKEKFGKEYAEKSYKMEGEER